MNPKNKNFFVKKKGNGRFGELIDQLMKMMIKKISELDKRTIVVARYNYGRLQVLCMYGKTEKSGSKDFTVGLSCI